MRQGNRQTAPQGRELLSALFAQQLGFARADDLVAAGSEWLLAREKGQSLCDVLVQRGLLDAQRRKLVDALVEEAIAASGGDPATTLDTLPTAMQESLSGLSRTLRSNSLDQTDAGDFSFDSLETPENIGLEDRGRYTFDTGPTGKTEELGRGGVGHVVVARDHFLSRDVAFKALHRDLTTSTSVDTLQVRHLEARFLREARVTAQLDHPAIVPVYELGRRRDGTLYYTMQRVRGRTLAQAMTDARSLAGRLAFVPDLLTATLAVASAHHRRVIHRDLKPQNVMLGVHGETYVMDWGLARVIGRGDRAPPRPVELAPDLTAGRDMGPVGTPSYMSPEQAWGRHEEVDERSDVWGLGAMLFELLTGRAPYVGHSPWDVLADVRSEPVPRVRALEPAAPAELVAICEKALCRERSGRYANGTELAADLSAWVNGQRVQAYEYTTREVLSRLATRHRAVLMLVVVMVLALLGVGVAGALAVRQERDEARAMARFFLSDVSPKLDDAPGAGAVVEQLSKSALEAFSEGLDFERGPREDRLLLARTWNSLGMLAWGLGRREDAARAAAAARSLLEPLRQGSDDPAVLTQWLLLVINEADLLLDDGRDDEARARLEGLSSVSARLSLLAPDDVRALHALSLVSSRLGGIALNDRAGADEARAPLRQAAALAERWRNLAPTDSQANSMLVANLAALALADLAVDPALSTRALRRAVEIAREARGRGDSMQTRETLWEALLALGTVLVGRDDAEARATLLEAETLLAAQVRATPGEISPVSSLIDLELLVGKPAEAWKLAETFEEGEAGGEFEASIVLAGFAAGLDRVVLEHLDSTSPLTRDAAVCYGALVHALNGRPREAQPLAASCREARALERELWLSPVLASRASKVNGPLGTALMRLATELPAALNTRTEASAAWARFEAALTEAAR